MKLGFTVKASSTVGNSTADLAKKNKGSVASITKVLRHDGGDVINDDEFSIKKLVHHKDGDDNYTNDDDKLNMNKGRWQLWWFPRLHHKQGEEEYKEHRQVRLDFFQLKSIDKLG